MMGCNNDSNKQNAENSANNNEKKVEITILAAASLTDVCDEIKGLYEKKNNVKLNFSYASSGALQTQIEEGIKADMFMSASKDQMNTLSEGGYIEKDSIKNLLENKVVLITPPDKTDITSFEDLKTDKVKLI